jgi:CDP-3, 6-dideoxy-D-glycero-L-glycero-4-hexulose-4-reductase
MKILVLGGSGFLGKKLIDNLSQQSIELFAAVRNIPSTSNQNCTYVLVDDLGKDSSLGPLVFDVIINVAMKRSSRHLPVSDEVIRELNYEIPLSVIRRYSNQSTLVINSSTYIQNYKGVKGQTVETYGATKELLSIALKSDADTGLYRVLDLYLFTLYGPGDRESHLVPLLLSAIRNRTVVSLSEGNQLMNLLYAQDAVDSIVGAITNGNKGYSAYHLWEPVYFTVRDLVLAIEQALGTNLKVEWGAVPYGGHEMFEPWATPFPFYPSLVPKVGLEEGLKICANLN